YNVDDGRVVAGPPLSTRSATQKSYNNEVQTGLKAAEMARDVNGAFSPGTTYERTVVVVAEISYVPAMRILKVAGGDVIGSRALPMMISELASKTSQLFGESNQEENNRREQSGSAMLTLEEPSDRQLGDYKKSVSKPGVITNSNGAPIGDKTNIMTVGPR
ncbi:hypothetical protein TELCIR_12437, partial [Teladorsagia circumcincta]